MVPSMELFGPASLERGKDPISRTSEVPPWCEQICAQKLCGNPAPKAIPVVSHASISLPFQPRLLLPLPILKLSL